MRPRLLLPLLMVPALSAQGGPVLDPADARAASVRAGQDGVTPVFFWLRPKDHLYQGSWELDPRLGRIIAAGEIRYGSFEDGEQQAWAARLGWGLGPHWVLLSPKGEPLLSGDGFPKVDAWLDAMRATGWVPFFERCDEFLREHPDQGDAWGEALREATRYAARRAVVEKRLNPATPKEDPGINVSDPDLRPTPPEQDQAQWGPAKEALDGLMKVEGWTNQRNLPVDVIGLRFGGVMNSQIMRDPLHRLRQGIEAALGEHPSDERLWSVWESAHEIAPGAEPQTLLAGLDPLPRAPWPPLASADALGEAFMRKEDWAGLESLASRAYGQAMDPAVSLYQGKDFRAKVVRAWAFWRLLPLVKQGREQEAQSLVKELRAQMGSRWPDYASSALGPSLAYYLGKDDPVIQTLRAAAKEKAPPDLPKLVFPPVPRLALIGHPGWEREWDRYKMLSAFDDWEPGEELAWQALKPDEEQRLRARMGWGAEPRWVLLRGDDLLASGFDLPKPSFLADRLRAEGEPYHEQLHAFIRIHPDELEAREARIEALRSRMPNERLEATLMEDARVALAPFESDPPGAGWVPRKALWAPASRRALPELEARLQRWPENRGLWLAWLDWSAVSDHPPSPTRLMERLAIWKSRYNGGAGPLPDDILVLGSRHLKDEGRWQDLADWCLAFWEGGIRADLARLAAPMPGVDRRERARKGEKRELYIQSLLAPAQLALGKLGRTAQLHAFIQDLKDIDPLLAKAITGTSSGPRPD